MNKKIFKTSDIKDKILRAVDTINNPVRQTLSPKGGNVMYEDDRGELRYTNDGYTIVNSIQVKDPVENAIIEIIKGGSRKTNLEAGDGTSSTVVMSSLLIKEGLKLIENGFNQMDVRDQLNKFASDMKKELVTMSTQVNGDKDIKLISKISASNDEKIADDVVKIIKVVGLDGQIIIDRGYGEETEIIEDTGFVLKTGMYVQELVNQQYQSDMRDVPVLITDKRLYYKSEAETILNTVSDAGYNEVVIIAQDFIGEALPFFVANHQNNKIKITLIVEKKLELLEDLAIYLGGHVISDKKGMLVDNISIGDFTIAKRVFTDLSKCIISRDKKEKNKNIDIRVKTLKNEMKKIGNKNDPEYNNLSKRVSSLTNGMVTIKVSGATPLDVMEKIHRYEDAISASRASLKEGYLPGAGVAVFNAFKNIKVLPEFEKMFKLASEINIRQISENCGLNGEVVLDKINCSPKGFGYNANKNIVENVVKSGIIEPLLVTTQVIANAVSIANIIVTSRYIIVNDLEDIKNNKEN